MRNNNLKIAHATLVIMVLMGSFLLFSMEPIIGRLALPFFGSSVHVWNTCIIIFQGLLLVGYLYAHYIMPYIGKWHLAILLLPLLQLPLDFVTIPTIENPLIEITYQLLIQISLPFTALTTTAVTAQYWFAHSRLSENHEPYYLYGSSNIGSLLALLGYPFLIEPWIGLAMQRFLWSIIYLMYFAISVYTWNQLSPQTKIFCKKYNYNKKPLSFLEMCKWLCLAIIPSALLLGVSNIIATKVGSFPLVWVIPLALYLGSFILTFRENGGIPKWLSNAWFDLIIYCLALTALIVSFWQVAVLTIIFFILCVIVHGELYRIRPDVRYLTHFYLILALGGFLGGATVTLFAPVLFQELTELPVTLLCLLAVLFWTRGLLTSWSRLPKTIPYYQGIPRAIGIITALCWIGTVQIYAAQENIIFKHRNFYGYYKVVQNKDKHGQEYRSLVHGGILHGAQYTALEKQEIPLAYYHQNGPLMQILNLRKKPANIAVIGLGTGAMAASLEKGEKLVFYEIDEDIELLAKHWFTYLTNCQADVEVRVGDARLKFWQENQAKTSKYDIVIIDAFSGDGIPIHLITKEALEIYIAQLKPNGILTFHISNNYYDLKGVLTAHTKHFNWHAAYLNAPKDNKIQLSEGSAVFAMAKQSAELLPLTNSGWTFVNTDTDVPAFLFWTDDYNSILFVLEKGKSEKKRKN